MRWKRIRSLLLLTLSLGAFLVDGTALSYAGQLPVQTQAPNFSRKGLHQTRISLRSYRGKVVLLNFWATWCAPCLLEMPRFVDWQKQYDAQGVQVLGVSMDDDESLVRSLEKKLHMNYPVVMGDEKLGELYGGVLGLPVTYLIDRKGKIRAVFQGETDLARTESQLKLLLLEPWQAPRRR